MHAELTRMGGEWVVCDEGMSHNGTFVNGERVLRPAGCCAAAT